MDEQEAEERGNGEDDEDEAAKEERREAERKRQYEYLQFRREFDKIKQKHEGMHAESEKLKAQGNQFFSLGCYAQAAMLYGEALELQPENHVLYCNRAMAYLKQDMADEALADAVKSLELDATAANIKAYWRQAQALLDLDRPEEAEAAADAGLALQAGNDHLNRVRRKAREASTLRRLCAAPWVASVQSGVEKRLAFARDGVMTMRVFGHEVPATFDLSVEGNPRSMYVKMKPIGNVAGTGPPPPPVPYIYEFHGAEGAAEEELWLCHPVQSNELPRAFEGPGFDRLRRAPADDAVDGAEGASGEPLDARCSRYLKEMNEVLPLIPPQLPDRPSEEEISAEAVMIDKMSRVKRQYGLQVHQRAMELAKDPSLAGEGTELSELALGFQRRLVLRKIMPPPPALVEELAAPAVAAAADQVAGGGAAAPPAPTAGAGAGAGAGGRALGCLGRLSARCCGGAGGGGGAAAAKRKGPCA